MTKIERFIFRFLVMNLGATLCSIATKEPIHWLVIVAFIIASFALEGVDSIFKKHQP